METESWYLEHKSGLMRWQGRRMLGPNRIAQGGKRCDFPVSRGQLVHVEPEFQHA